MTKKTTIKYISDLMNNPGRLTAGDQGSIGGLRQSFPYFVPVRYLDAVTLHRESPYSPAMLSAISPYMGNWILFSDFMDASLQVAANEIADNSSLQGPEKLHEVVEETSIPSEQDSITVTDDIVDEIPSPASMTAVVEEANSEIAAIDAVSYIRELSDVVANAAVVADVEIATENEAAIITPAIAPEEAVIVDEQAIIEDILPEDIQVMEQISGEEIILPVIAEVEVAIATEPAVIEDKTPEEHQAIDNSAATAEILPTEISVEEDTNAQQTATVTTSTENNNEPEQLVTSNTAEVMAETNIIDNVADTSTTDIEEEHKNFWSQGDEASNTTTTEANTLSSVAAPIPDQLPIKKTPAPEPTAQSQVPDEEFRPTQHTRQEKPLIYPIYTEDYFLQQGEKISPVLPTDIDSLKTAETAEEAAKSLMVMMSFSEWLLHFKSSTEKQKEETKDQRALKTMWQKEKLAAAIEEENEEIPENVFEMAVNSITKEDGLASESLADIYIKQGKLDKAIDMYRKLSLRNPQKNAYFARKIEEILKEKQL
jgi:hypothetical protein